jgi:4-diphosphocytidyl-2-C-methyl-D-erythritol kinase
MMSGSGPTVFALCESEVRAQQVKQEVSEAIGDPELNFWITKLSSAGIQVAS